MSRRSMAALALAALVGAGAFGAKKDLVVGGALAVTFEDRNVSAAPGPELGSDRNGTVADFSVGMANEYVAAGLKISLALGDENTAFNSDPISYLDMEGYSRFPLSSAYIRLMRVFEIAEIQFDLNGNLIGIGNKVVTNESRQGVVSEGVWESDPRTGLTLSVPGILEYLTFRLAANEDPGLAAYTKSDGTSMAAVPDVWAGKASLLFEGDVLTLGVAAGVFDALKYKTSWFAGTEAQAAFGERLRATVAGEASFLGTYYGTGAAAWAGLVLEAAGTKVSGNVYGKSDRFGSDTTVLAISSAKNEFDSRKGVHTLAVDGSVSYNPRALIGSELLTIAGGGSAMLTGARRWGWTASATLALAKVVDLPLMLGGDVWKYGDSGLGIFGNTALLWKAWATYDYHGLAIRAELGRREYDDLNTKTKRDAAFGYTLSASVAF